MVQIGPRGSQVSAFLQAAVPHQQLESCLVKELPWGTQHATGPVQAAVCLSVGYRLKADRWSPMALGYAQVHTACGQA